MCLFEKKRIFYKIFFAPHLFNYQKKSRSFIFFFSCYTVENLVKITPVSCFKILKEKNLEKFKKNRVLFSFIFLF